MNLGRAWCLGASKISKLEKLRKKSWVAEEESSIRRREQRGNFLSKRNKYSRLLISKLRQR
jgi:hypothetical protein